MKGQRVPLEAQAARRRASNRAWHWEQRAKGRCKACGQIHPGLMWLCQPCRVAASAKDPQP